MTTSTIATSAALVLVLLQLILPSANACYIMGKAVCDKCWDGDDSDDRTAIAWSSVSANCSISCNGKTAYIAGSGTTVADGSFKIVLNGATSTTLLSLLYPSSNPLLGLLPTAKVSSCVVSVNSPTCSVQTFHDGACNKGCSRGNGQSTNLGLVNPSSKFIDIQINGNICNSPATRDNACPALPPPPSTPVTSASPPPPVTSASPPPPKTPGATGDPHFTGADGSQFDFSGEPNATFCLVSDEHIHINAFYGGRYDRWGNNMHKSLTWIRKIAILWGDHKIVLATREGARWQYDNGYLASIEIDGASIHLNEVGDYVTAAKEAIEVRWVGAKVQSADDLIDIYQVTVADVLKLRFMLRPEIAILRTEKDGLVHVDFEMPMLDVSDNVHGILGQTYRSDHRNRLATQNLEWSDLLKANVVPGDNAEGFLDGVEADYVSSDLLMPDCGFSRFSGATKRTGFLQAVELTTTKGVNTNGVLSGNLKTDRKTLTLL